MSNSNDTTQDQDLSHKEIDHEIHGNGKHKIILIPGLMVDRALWKYQVEHILKSEKDCEILTINNYGIFRDTNNGQSRSYYDRSRMSKYSHDIKILMDCYGWEKATLIGISMGGMITLRFAVMYPKKVVSMVLINTHSGGYSGLPKLAGVYGIAKHFVCPGHDTYFNTIFGNSEKNINNRTIRDISESNDLSHVTKHNVTKILTAITQIIAIFTHYITQEEFRKINKEKIPSLIVTGLNDNILDPKASIDIYQNLENSELFIMKEAGHFLIMDDHGEDTGGGHVFNEKLSEFLKKYVIKED